jgi:hypothetical protein
VQTPASVSQGGTGWLLVSHANCPGAHVDALQVSFPYGPPISDGSPQVVGNDLEWTFGIPSDAGLGNAQLSLSGSGVDIDGNPTSGTITVYIPITS